MMPSELDSSEFRPEALRLVGTIVSERYRIERVLGEGGMGAVYLAEHVLMHKRLAVKVLHPEMIGLPDVVRRFEREALAASHIDHPNVAAATDFGKLEDGSFFLVLEYVEGKNLYDVLSDGPLPAERALRVAHQIASALARAHALGIVHRDLKPENVMLVERDGDPDFVKVLDFGIAKVSAAPSSPRPGRTASGPSITRAGAVFGTPEYMAPEQALGHEVDARADLYSLGVVLFEMLAGVRPFDSDGKATLLGMKVVRDAPALASMNPGVHVPEPVEAIVRRLLERDLESRFQDAHQVLDAIEASGVWTARTRAGSMGPAVASTVSLPPPAVRGALLPPLLPRLWTSSMARPWMARVRAWLAKVATRRHWAGARASYLWAKLPARFRRPMSRELVAGVATGFLFVAIGVKALGSRSSRVENAPSVRASGVAESVSSIPSASIAPVPTRLPDLAPAPVEDTSSASSPGTSTSNHHASQTKLLARPKRLPGGLTDFGGRL